MLDDTARGPLQPAGLASEWSTRFAYSYGFHAGGLVVVAGQIARDGAGQLVGIDDVEAQTIQVFENIKAVVDAAGGTLADVIATRTYIVSRPAREIVTAVRHRYFSGPDYPTNTLLIVGGLGLPEYLVEIEALAVVPRGAS